MTHFNILGRAIDPESDEAMAVGIVVIRQMLAERGQL